MKWYIGVDPGKNGGLAIYNGIELHTIVMPLAGDDINITIVDKFLHNIESYELLPSENVMCIIEKVGAMPKQGVRSMFTFGYNVGMLHGIFGAFEIPRQIVTPQLWKKVVLEGTAKDKDAAKDWCSRTFPGHSFMATEQSKVMHSGMCDATCIAMYAYKQRL